MKPEQLQSWLGVVSMLLSLGVPIAKLVALIKETLSPADADLVLLGVKSGWVIAGQENDARIAQLEAAIAAGQSPA